MKKIENLLNLFYYSYFKIKKFINRIKREMVGKMFAHKNKKLMLIGL
jgi:hypothetical protein